MRQAWIDRFGDRVCMDVGCNFGGHYCPLNNDETDTEQITPATIKRCSVQIWYLWSLVVWMLVNFVVIIANAVR